MNNFFIEDYFCDDLDSLMSHLGISEEEVPELDDAWEITCEKSKLEKIFTLKQSEVEQAILNATDNYEERFPEDSEETDKKVKTAINHAIDLDKLNELLPSLYYPTGEIFKVTKIDLLDYCNSVKADAGGCFNADGSRKYCKHMLFTTAQAGVLCNNKEANYLLCHVANFKPCDYFEEDKNRI